MNKQHSSITGINKFRYSPRSSMYSSNTIKGLVPWFLFLIFSLVILGLFIYMVMSIFYKTNLNQIKQRARDCLSQCQFIVPRLKPKQLQNYIESVHPETDMFRYLLVMDTKGNAIAHSDPSRVGMNFFESGFEKVIKTGLDIEQIYIRDAKIPTSPFYGEKTIDMISPYYSIDGKILGVVNIGLSLKSIDRLHDFYVWVAVIGSTIWVILITVVVFLRFKYLSEFHIIESNRQNEERYSTIIAVSNTGAWEYHRDKDYLWCSPEYFYMLGYDQIPIKTVSSANLKVAWIDLLHPEDKERATKTFSDYQNQDSNVMYENYFRMQHKNGHWVWIWSRGRSLRNSDGSLTNLIVGTHIDISERKRAEDVLNSTISLLNASLESTADGILVVNTVGKIIKWNQKFIDLFKVPDYLLDTTIDNLLLDYVVNQMVHPQEFLDRVRYLYDHLSEISFDLLELTDGRIFERYSQPQKFDEEIVGRVWSFRDVTERKQTEKLLHDVIKYNPISIQVVDRDGYTLQVNPAHTKLFGVEVPKDYSIFEDPQVVEQGLSALFDRAKKGEVVHFPDFKYNPRDLNPSFPDKPMWIRVVIFPLFDNSGIPERFVFMHEDTNESKRAEAIVRANEKMRLAADAAKFGVWDMDIINQSLEWDDWMFKLFDQTKEEFTGKLDAWKLTVHPDDVEYTNNNVNIALQGDHDFETEFRIIRSNGEIRHLKAYGVVQRDQLGNPLRMTGINYDITELKRAETALRDSEQKLIALFSAMTEIVALHELVFDINNKPIDYRILDVNQSFINTFKYKKEDVIGKLATEVYKSDFPPYFDEFSKVAITGEPTEFTTYYEPTKMHFAVSVVSPKQNQFATITTDITDRKLMEFRLVEKERLSAIGELASGIAHDFNNSLQAIIGNIELALFEPDLSPEVQKYLNTIKNTTFDASARVKQLQRFVRKDKENIFKPYQITQIIKESIEQTRPIWKDLKEKSGVGILIETDFQASGVVNGNIGELRSAFYNLINNALEAMPTGGTITLLTSENDKEFIICIKDTGCGMSEETAKRVFQPFFTTKGFELGRGLGLSSVHSIIRDHGGTIFIKETVVGKGTIVEMTLPKGENMNRNETESPQKTIDSNKILKILWVDDEENIRNIGTRLIKKLGHYADTAESGEDALSLLEKNSYDLLITDVGMPGINGWQLSERIKGRYNLKVAVVTGWGAEVTDEDKAKAGVNFVIGKPISFDELKRLIDITMLNG